MGQNSCCSGKYQKLLQNQDNKIIDFIMGIEGVGKAKDFFQNNLKEKVSSQFNKLPSYPFKERDYMKTMQKIDQDRQSQLGKLDTLKNSLTDVPEFRNLPLLQKDNLILYAKEKFKSQIGERLKNYQESMKGMYNVEKYINFLK